MIYNNEKLKIKLINDSFANYEKYNIPKANLILADIPYNIGKNAYVSNPSQYNNKIIKQGQAIPIGRKFFDTDENFCIDNFFKITNNLLIDEPKEVNKAPAMIIFCSFDQTNEVIEKGKKYGLKKYYPLIFIKKNSPQALKSNIKILGGTEYAMVLYRDKLPKFNNNRLIDENGKTIHGTGEMILNWFNWDLDMKYNRIHPCQKPITLLKRLIEIFTDENDIIIDPVAGSASTLVASSEMNRISYGFEIEKKFYDIAKEKMFINIQKNIFVK